MAIRVAQDNHPIDSDTRGLISKRYKAITKAINQKFWNSDSETAHSIYVGSYGRGTAVATSDLDVLVELPGSYYEQFTNHSGNGQSHLLQTGKDAIASHYATTSMSGDGQVVVINFSDGMRFEILPAFKHTDYWGSWDGTYIYPDTHMGGNWLSTNPKAEQEAMSKKDQESNGLLRDTCKHVRAVKADYFSSYHLSGILIDSFIYLAIQDWHWLRDGEEDSGKPFGTYERVLWDYYNDEYPYPDMLTPQIKAPGSGMKIDTESDWEVLGKVLKKIAGV